MSDEKTLAEKIATFMDSGKPKVLATTPKGVAIYPHLTAEDNYQLTENGKHECNTQLLLDPEVAEDKAFIDHIDEANQAAYEHGLVGLNKALAEAKGKKKVDLKKAIEEMVPYPPYEPEYDDEGEETGRIIFKMKATVAGVNKKTEKAWSKELPLWDSSNAAIKGKARDDLKLWGGSVIRVSLQLIPYCAEGLLKAGVSLRILAVQVLSTPEGGGSAEQHGFGVEEGGYQAPEFADPAENAPVDSDDDEGDDDF